LYDHLVVKEDVIPDEAITRTTNPSDLKQLMMCVCHRKVLPVPSCHGKRLKSVSFEG